MREPAGTLLWVEDPASERAAIAREEGTLVLSISGVPPSGSDTGYLEG